MLATFHNSIADVDATQWNSLWRTQHPFTQHGFLSAVEKSDSVDTLENSGSGWQVQHLTVAEGEKLIAVAPLFVKTHSYGEYVFDWSWANAYHQAGIDYYPKLLNAIPFTPATGPRIGWSADLDDKQKTECFTLMWRTIQELVKQQACSGFHSLFPTASATNHWQNAGFVRRIGYQFHWFNHDYRDFDDFLASFSSRKRKNLKKERAKVHAQPLDIRMRHAAEISREEWDTFYALYHRTYLKRSGHAGYLGTDFFHQLALELPHNVLLASAHHRGQMIAAALYLRDENTLYGRYWGSKMDVDGLHFECCYYQGIEYAIAHGLQRFDPGAQGEHKIQRGFTPIKTQSYHWLAHPAFNRAIRDFVAQEARQIEHYLQDARSLLPFKEGVDIASEDILLA